MLVVRGVFTADILELNFLYRLGYSKYPTSHDPTVDQEACFHLGDDPNDRTMHQLNKPWKNGDLCEKKGIVPTFSWLF